MKILGIEFGKKNKEKNILIRVVECDNRKIINFIKDGDGWKPSDVNIFSGEIRFKIFELFKTEYNLDIAQTIKILQLFYPEYVFVFK